VTIVTVDESLTGWYTQIRRARNDEAVIRAYGALQRVVKELALVPILSFDATAADVARKLRLKDRRMGTNDLRIAAIAVSNSATLITRNLKDFSRLADLTVEDWSVRSPLSE
jgi:tRNA(fMet)-specific endonuclease VapC